MSSPPFTPNEALPTDNGVVSLFPGQERTFREIIESWLLWEHDTSGYHSFDMDTTVNRDADATRPAGSLFYNTTTDVLQFLLSIGPQVWDTISFPAATRMLFQQTSAPPGWTKVTDAAFEDCALRLTTGAVGAGVEGTVNFTDLFTSQAIEGTVEDHVLTEGELPVHSHFAARDEGGGTNPNPTSTTYIAVSGSGSDSVTYSLRGVATAADVGPTSEVGEDEGHGHTFTGTALDLAVRYRDVILAVKD